MAHLKDVTLAQPKVLLVGIAGARVFVVPNPSGLNASFPGFSQKLVWFVALSRFVERANRGS